MKRAAVIAALLTLAFPVAARADSLTLDSSATKVSADSALTDGQWYVITVTGTSSFHYASTWSHPDQIFKHATTYHAVICGTPEDEPMFGPKRGKVGFDAETLFARPATRRSCVNDPSPHRSRRFQIDAGEGWYHTTPLDGRYSTPRADHTYAYAVMGHGVAPAFRVTDDPLYDNYGNFKIDIRPATPADCANNQYKNFLNYWGSDVMDYGDCLAITAPAPVTAT